MNLAVTQIVKKPMLGSVLSVVSGLAFFFTLMLLPLVGPAGSRAPDADKNQLAYLGVLGLTFVLAALATGFKLMRRKLDQSPFPVWSSALCVVCIIFFILQLTGLLAI